MIYFNELIKSLVSQLVKTEDFINTLIPESWWKNLNITTHLKNWVSPQINGQNFASFVQIWEVRKCQNLVAIIPNVKKIKVLKLSEFFLAVILNLPEFFASQTAVNNFLEILLKTIKRYCPDSLCNYWQFSWVVIWTI